MATYRSLPWLGWCLIVSLGCGQGSTSLSGNVTYDGKPLEAGYITLFPLDGRGKSHGTDIVDGRYHLEDLSPGTFRALVTTPPRYAPDPKEKSGLKKLPQTVVPTNAPGNRQQVDLRAGAQTVDIAMKKPGG